MKWSDRPWNKAYATAPTVHAVDYHSVVTSPAGVVEPATEILQGCAHRQDLQLQGVYEARRRLHQVATGARQHARPRPGGTGLPVYTCSYRHLDTLQCKLAIHTTCEYRELLLLVGIPVIVIKHVVFCAQKSSMHPPCMQNLPMTGMNTACARCPREFVLKVVRCLAACPQVTKLRGSGQVSREPVVQGWYGVCMLTQQGPCSSSEANFRDIIHACMCSFCALLCPVCTSKMQP